MKFNMWKSEPITTTLMQILGREGEQEARNLLKTFGYHIMQIDWMGKKNGKYVLFEIKKKKKFQPPPFAGHGLDLRQVMARMEFYKDTKIDTIFMVKDIEDNNWYWNYLSFLENHCDPKDKFTTKNKIRIYSLAILHKI